MLGQSRKSVSVATALLLCYSVGQLASTGWWLFQLSGQASCPLDNEGAWSIGIYKGTSPFSLQPLESHEPQEQTPVAWPVANPVLTCASIGDVPSTFVADPFLWQHHSGLYLFYEVKNLAKGRGEIGVAQSGDGGATFKHLGVVLDEPWHLSYPFIFGYKGQIYMLPEASGSGQLRLYRAKSFPLHWVLDRVLLDRPLVDASPVQWAGRWWMLASNPTRSSARNLGELEVWHADSPLGPWKEHALNPVVNGAPHLGARSGGRPLVYEGKLYRFGQDCGETYGHKLVAYEVTKLTPTEFEQEPARLALAGPASSSSRGQGKLRWNSARQHHIDVQQLPSGEWVAAVDGDRVPSGTISRELLRCAGRALWPWLTLCAAWGALQLAARRSPAMRRWLLAGPAARLLGRPSKRGLLGLHEQHKRDDSDDVELQQGGGEAKTPNGRGGSVLSIRIKADGGGLAYAAQQPQETGGAGSWWGRGWGRVSQRRLRNISPAIEGPLSPSSSFRKSTVLHRVPAWALALAAAAVAAACLAAVGGWLYVRPYFMPYQAIAVEGQFSQFTLVSMSYEARMPTLRHMVRHYSRCPSVGEIVLVWNKGRPPNPENDFDSAVPVRVRVEPLNSLNNRFKVDHLIRNRAVLSLDDDIIMPCGDIERGFAVWRQQPQKMVGFFPRLMEGSPLVFQGESYSIRRGLYNAVLTGAAFLDSWTAFPAYWADAVAPARATVDEVFNGEDLLMNFVLANRTHHLLAAAGASEVRRRRQEQEERRDQMLAGQRHRQQQQLSLQRRQQQQQRQVEQGHSHYGAEVDGLPDSAIEFIAPTRRVDISKLSGVGISRDFERFKQQAAHYLANFTATFGYLPLESLPHKWTEQSRPPFCAIGWLGCTYLN